METWKKIALGVGTILLAVSGWVVAMLDKDDTTNPDTKATIEKIGEGVSIIRSE